MRNVGFIGVAVLVLAIFIAIAERTSQGNVDWYGDSTHISQRSGGNFIAGAGVTITRADDPTNSRVGLTFAATGATTTSGYFNQAGDLLTTFASASGTISFATTTAVGQSLTANDTRIAFDTTTDLILGDNVAVAWGAESDSRLYYDGADTFLNLRNAGSGDLMVALAGSFPSPDTGVHIWRGTAGSIAATAESILVLETPSGQDSWVQFLSPNNRTQGILFGDPESAAGAGVRYSHANTRMEFHIEGSPRAYYTAGTVAFQEATTINTSAGDLVLDAASNFVVFGGSGTADAAVILDVDGTDWYVGVDDSVSDEFSVGIGTAVGSSVYLRLDTDTTVSNTSLVHIGKSVPTITLASGATSRLRLVQFQPRTINYTGNTQVTSRVEWIAIDGFTIEADGVGGDLTVDNAATLFVNAPIEGSADVILTASSAVRITNQGTGVPVTQYGLHIENLTSGASDIAVYIADADTYSIHSDAGLNRFDGDGTHVFELPADTATSTAANTGRIPVTIGGVTKYLRYYDD